MGRPRQKNIAERGREGTWSAILPSEDPSLGRKGATSRSLGSARPSGRGRLAWHPRAAVFSVALTLLAAPVLGDAPKRVLHERFVPDPVEDLALGATTENGRMPSALETRVGAVSAPAPRNPDTEPAPEGTVYGGEQLAGVGASRFRLDGITEPPLELSYHDPFRPGTAPYKRLYVYDYVKSDFSLGVRSPDLNGVPTEGTMQPSDEAFFADFSVDLEASVPVRIVSVAAGARVLSMFSEPERELQLFEDGAENWFLKGKTKERVRVVMQLAAPGRAFAFRARLGNFRTVESPFPVSEQVLEAARPVLARMGVSRELAPSVALERMVAYFRNFRASAELPRATDPVELYRELSLTQRGVCRHRAFAFVVSAMALGLRARMVMNEAHAWVEVFDGDGFSSIDLGGAAPRFSPLDLAAEVPLYEPEPDPFAWPLGQSSGHELGRRMRRDSASAGARGWPSANAPSVQTSVEPSAAPVASDRPDVALEVSGGRVKRGSLLEVRGAVRKPGAVCAHARVDIFLERADHSRELLGSVLTDAKGSFTGQVTLPRDAPLGQAQLLGEAPGACGATKR